MGFDKARLALPDGSLMIERAVRRLSEVCARVAVVVDRADRYADLALPAGVIVDTTPRAGPLAALRDALAGIETECALVVACDMPHLDVTLLRHMLALPRTYDALVPMHEGRPQVLHAIYSKRCLPPATRLLASGERSLQALLREVQTQLMEEDDWRRIAPNGASFTNINAPSFDNQH
jgi:molybdopterin-guanine dinucleotide biosynthesis protein A